MPFLLRSMSTAFQGTEMYACPSDQVAPCTSWKDEECTSCPGGQKRDLATSGCIACSPGQFALANNKMYECYPCSAGNYSGAGSASCSACAAGKYNDKPGQTACSSCLSAGDLKYQSKAGQASCDTCSDGLKPTSIFDACTCVEPCAKGK